MITYIMQTRRSDEFILSMNRKGWLDIEGMTTRQSDEGSVTGDPFVGSVDITMIGVVGEIPHGGC